MNKTTTETKIESPSPAEDARRESEIREILQGPIERHKDWLKQPAGIAYPGNLVLDFARAIWILISVGRFPQSLASTWFCLGTLADKAVRILNMDPEAVDGTGSPKQTWFTELDRLIHVTAPKRVSTRNCPQFASLWEEFSNDQRQNLYLARAFGIWDKDLNDGEGRWRGPLFTESGEPNASAIMREHLQPGSVIPANFHPEDLRNAAPLIELPPVAASTISGLRRCLDIAGVSLEATVVVQGDPLSVEELLYAGQFVPVIARLKGVSESEVRETAARLGVRAMYSTDAFPVADIHSQADSAIRLNMMGNLTEFPSGSAAAVPSSPAEVPEAAESDSDDLGLSLDDALRGMLESNLDIDTLNAMRALKSQGIVATGVQVGRRLTELRQAMTAAAGS